MRLSRRTLHTWLWRLPQDELCEVVGIAPNTLAKLCKTHRIPAPPRGHWRKVETGKAVTVEALTDPTDDPELDYEVDEAKLVRRAEIFDRRRLSSSPVAEVVRSDQRSAGGDSESAMAPVSPCDLGAATVAIDADLFDESAFDPRSAEQLLQLADRYRRFAVASSLIDEAECIRERCDPGTSAVLSLWLSRARESLVAASPAQQIVAACWRIAVGAALPVWWREISGRTGKS